MSGDRPQRDSRARRRWRRNLITAAAALAAGAAAGMAFDQADLRSRLSAATAYIGLGAVALSLTLGPLNVLRHRSNPASNDFRRDLGIWGGLVGLVHVGVGLTVHFRGRMHLYFVPPPDDRGTLPIRLDAFGIANHLGLIAGLVLLMLLALSSDGMLRRLGTSRWKAFQRFNYLGALAILAHGAIYQVLEGRRRILVAVFAAVVVGTLVLQILGVRAVRRTWRRSRPSPT